MTPEDYPEYCNVTPMTSSSEQPKEYIITEFQLKQLQDFASLEFVCQAIRKRPHPAPQEDGCKFRVAKMEAMYDNGYADGSRKAREGVLGLARDMYSLMMCVEKTNTDEFMEHYADRMKGLKEQYDSLRTTTPQPEQEQSR